MNILKQKNKTLKIACVALFFLGLLIFGVHSALATVTYDIDDGFPTSSDDQDNLGRNYIIGENFKPTTENITGIVLYGVNDGTGMNITVHVCYGHINNDNTEINQALDNCTPAVTAASCTIVNYSNANDPTASVCYFDKTYTLTANDNYYLIIEGNQTDDFGLEAWNGNWTDAYTDGNYFMSNRNDSEYWSDYGDLAFKTFYDDDPQYNGSGPDVEIIELPNWQGTVSVESEYELQFNRQNYCTINNQCYLWVNYNPEVVGHTIYLLPSDADGNCDYNLNNSVDSFTPEQSVVMQDYFHPTATSSPTTDYYCILDDVDNDGKVSDNDVVYKDVSLTWTYEPTVLNKIFEDYNCDTICDDIATGTDYFNFSYGIQCGFRKILCWGFVPSQDTLIKFARAVYNIEHAFPFTIYNQVENTIQGVDLATSTAPVLTAKWSTFGLPSDAEMTIASTTMMTDTFGILWQKIYGIMETFVYLLGFLYLIWRIFKLSRATNDY